MCRICRIYQEDRRPAEVELLLGSPAKAEAKLGWKRRVSFEDLVGRMVDSDMRLVAEEMAHIDR